MIPLCLPQIVTFWRCREGARSLSLWTWGWWTASHVTAAPNRTLMVNDVFLVAFSMITLIGWGVVTLIAARRRLTARQAAGSSPLGWRNA